MQLTLWSYWEDGMPVTKEVESDMEIEVVVEGDPEYSTFDYEQMCKDTLMLNEYQRSIEKFIMCEGDTRLMENTLGLVGEAGEVAEKLKKHIRDGGPLDVDAVVKELGDVLFYVAALSTHLDVDLSEVADINIEKLTDRKARGVIQGQGDNR